jgi:hypothetical protein
VVENILQGYFAQDQAIFIVLSNAVRTHPDLLQAFLAGNV